MFKYEVYTIGKKPRTLVVFLHGYNGDIADHQYAIDWIKDKLKNAILAIPEAPEVCDKNASKRQWFGMMKYDPEKKRINPQTESQEIFDIYNMAATEVDNRAAGINDFIDSLQKKYKINNDKTYLIGFSQGAMLTIYAALTRSQPIAHAFALSGLIAGSNLLEQKITAQPPLSLFHGEEDLKVQYKTLPDSLKWLKNHDIACQSHTYPRLAHKICEEEITEITTLINS